MADPTDYEYKVLALSNKDKRVVIKEPMFKDFLDLQKAAAEKTLNDSDLTKSILERFVDGYGALTEDEIPLVIEKFIKIASTTEYMDDVELLLLTLALYYRMNPVEIARLPASWGMVLLSEIKGMDSLKDKGVQSDLSKSFLHKKNDEQLLKLVKAFESMNAREN